MDYQSKFKNWKIARDSKNEGSRLGEADVKTHFPEIAKEKSSLHFGEISIYLDRLRRIGGYLCSAQANLENLLTFAERDAIESSPECNEGEFNGLTETESKSSINLSERSADKLRKYVRDLIWKIKSQLKNIRSATKYKCIFKPKIKPLKYFDETCVDNKDSPSFHPGEFSKSSFLGTKNKTEEITEFDILKNKIKLNNEIVITITERIREKSSKYSNRRTFREQDIIEISPEIAATETESDTKPDLSVRGAAKTNIDHYELATEKWSLPALSSNKSIKSQI